MWPTLSDALRIVLERTEIDDEGYLCYDGATRRQSIPMRRW
jgi:hypothetical protein